MAVKLLQGSGINIGFDKASILIETDFNLEEGELVGIIGPNGAGKTSLMRTIAGLLQPRSGEIRFLNQPMASISDRQRARQLAYLPQGNESHWDVTVETVVMLGRLPHRKSWKGPSERDREIVSQALRTCNVSHFSDRSINTLSGGEKARVMLARALAVEPRLLLADEPVAGLDPGHQLDVMEKFRQLSQSGMGIMIVLHDLTLAARYCSRLLLLFDKRILAQGKPQDVLSEENLAHCFGIRAHIGVANQHPFVIPVQRCRPG